MLYEVITPGDRLTILGSPEGIEALRALYAPVPRITSYNVCYTKLLRVPLHDDVVTH